jgi:hypothetical protein
MPLAAEEEDRSDIEYADHHHGESKLARPVPAINEPDRRAKKLTVRISTE